MKTVVQQIGGFFIFMNLQMCNNQVFKFFISFLFEHLFTFTTFGGIVVVGSTSIEIR